VATKVGLSIDTIERERDAALVRYRRDQDSRALDQAWARLEAEEREARRPREVEGVPADVAVRYLGELSTTWRKADGGPGRRMLAEALFSRIEVLGAREATIHLTDAAVAHGFATAIPDRLDVTVGYGRGERIGADTPSPILLIPVTNVPSYVHRASGIAQAPAGRRRWGRGRGVVLRSSWTVPIRPTLSGTGTTLPPILAVFAPGGVAAIRQQRRASQEGGQECRR
jgi:hypothetical protein